MTFAAEAPRLAALDLIDAARAMQRVARDEFAAECSQPSLVDS